jgi:uncharacterized protein (UPF0276 family)
MLPALASFAAEVGTPWIADHLGFRHAEGIDFGVSCPTLLDRRALDMVAARAVNAMSACGTRLLIRNLASPLAIENPIPEPEFLCRLCELAGCELSLDVCALMVNARNHHFDPRAWLAGIDRARIAQVHVGGCRDVNGRFDDTHDAPIDDETWMLIADALRGGTPDVVTLQWEARFPPTPVIESELRNLKALIAP